MSSLANAVAYDSDSKNSDDESKVEREVSKGQDPVPPLKRGLDQSFDKEIKKEMGDEEGTVKPESKKTKNNGLEESLNVPFPKEEPKDGYGELEAGMEKEQIPGSSFGEVLLKRELKEEYCEFGIEGGVCKKEPKVEMEEGEIQEPKDEYGELLAGMGMQQIPPEVYFGAVSLKREPKEEYSELTGANGGQDLCKSESKVELIEEESEEEEIDRRPLDVHDVIAGRERITFVVFKKLVESGRVTKEDMSVMRSARVIEVPGVGEVIQFLSVLDCNLKDFNKIDLKELKLDEVRILKEQGEKRGERAWVEVSEMFRKKGNTFLCNSCNTIHPNVESALNHLYISHPESGFLMSNKNQKLAKACLSNMCDPSLIFQHVAILDLETKKKYLKSHEINIYESAVELLSNVVDVKWAKVDRRGSLELNCKLCGDFSVAVNRGQKHKSKRYVRIRTSFVEHLSDVHPSDCQSLASQLEVAPGEKLKALLFEALCPDLYDLWSQMTKLHYE